METTRQATPAPMGVLPSAMVFAAFSPLLWLTVAAIIPWLRSTFGIPPIIGWYVSGTAFVLLPILFFGLAMAWWELPTRNLRQLSTRLRLSAMTPGDIVWAIGGLFTIVLASIVILALARYVDPSFRPAPDFLQLAPG